MIIDDRMDFEITLKKYLKHLNGYGKLLLYLYGAQDYNLSEIANIRGVSPQIISIDFKKIQKKFGAEKNRLQCWNKKRSKI